MKELDKKAKYLGIALFVERYKLTAFEDLRRKVQARIQGWKAKLLSQLGRATFVKHIAMLVPVYSMSTFLLPKVWCENFEKLARAFLWRNDSKVVRSFTPVAWRKACPPKFCGGLDVKRLWSFNKALIPKLRWSLITEKNKLWVKALKAKYFPYTSFMKCKMKKDRSWLWFGVIRVKPLLAKGVCYRVGKGDARNYWEDPWISNNPDFMSKPKHPLTLNNVWLTL